MKFILQYFIFSVPVLVGFIGYPGNKKTGQTPKPVHISAVQKGSREMLVEEEKIPAFEAWSKSIQTGAEIEMLEIDWPSDDLLCDGYPGSEGYMTFRIYRLKDSKKIVYVWEDGAYCQGDSEYGYEYYFDQDGYAVYSVTGYNEYVPTMIHFYQAGKPVVEVEYPSIYELDRQRKIRKPETGETELAKNYEKKPEEFITKIKERIAGLKTLSFKPSQTDKKIEADKTKKELEERLSTPFAYKGGYVFRKAMPVDKGVRGERTLLNGIDIRVRSSPGTSSKVIAKVSYYTKYISVIDTGPEETIQPFGKDIWYKISFYNHETLQYETGWIFGTFLVPNVYPEKITD